jgi:DNA-binding MarR family transcriptional regulator
VKRIEAVQPVPEWLNETEQRAWRGLLTMNSRLDAELNRRLQETSGLSQADYGVLVSLSEAPDGKLRVFEVAHSLSWEQSRLSHHLARMQKRGLIDREECSSDRRGAFVVLTAGGRSAIEAAAPAHVEAVRELVFDGLSDAQVRTLASVTEKVLKRIGSPENATG